MQPLKHFLRSFLNKSVLMLCALGLLLVFDETSAPAAENAQPLQLLSRSPQHAVMPTTLLTPEQDAWLGQKKVLKLGVSNPQYPPFDIINNKAEFEGITADYVGLIEEMLRVKVEVQTFPSRALAIKALQNHEIDLLSSATQFDQHEGNILLSEPYASEQSVLVTQANEKRAMGHYLAGRTLTMAEGFLPEEWVRAQYPQARLKIYPNYQEAVGAVAFGRADVYLGDLYPISKNFLNNMRVLKFADFPPKTFSFATAKDDAQLQDIINKTLAAVSTEEQLSILQRWHIGRSSMLLSQQIFQLSDEEKAWVARHPLVRVAVIDGYAPMTFIDDDGNYRGITIDVLAQIRLRTGLSFEIREASNVNQLKQMVSDGEADMIGALTPSSDRKQQLMFTRPYMTNAFVMVVRQQNGGPNQPLPPTSLSEMQGKRLAVIEGTGMIEKIRNLYPQIQLVMADNATDVLSMLQKGQADAALNTLVNSEYQIARFYRNSLRITSTIGSAPAYLSFAVPTSDPTLLSILDKVLLSIPPDELDVIGNLWRPNNMVAADNFWRENRTAIVTAVAFALALLLVSFFWASWLRRQVKLKERAQKALNDQLALRKKLLSELNLAKDQAEEANRAKTSFLSTMSHEIRTPLNAIIGMLEMSIKAAEEQKVDRQALDVAFNSANGLVELVGDILDIARIESGKLELNLEPANLRAITESVIRVFNGLALQKGLTLVLRLNDDSDCDVSIDPLRYKQILSNLIGNAIKFTAVGSVVVTVAVEPLADGENCEIVAEVRDSGIGIAADDLQKLFAPFMQVGDHAPRVRQGTGLGLVISKTLCEKMGGSIDIESQPGLGTKVTARVQVQRLSSGMDHAAVELDEAPAENGQPLRILVIDDYRANRLLLTKQLGYLGHRVTEAEDGVSGLESWQQGPRFDVVITDCNMPRMNGYQFAQAVRAAEQQQGAEPCMILGFTANALAEETERCLQAGMNGCLFKPSTLKDLSDWLRPITPLGGAEPQPEAADFIQSIDKLTGGDPRLASQLITELLRSGREDLQLLQQALQQQDAGQLAELAHKISGGARIVAASELTTACVQLEKQCRAAPRDMPQIEREAKVVIAQLTHFNQLLADAAKTEK
ncbi:transporter substrate-binding domain-containing protein [Ewingella americana]|uniref:histidine kinase n=2 Tax=Ewingella americana TaxID=41202 RepID=A0A085GLZ5_EWIA3|nr:transporter substrate-binding domain-containing protein [Ewingella americana]KAA8728796.1 transporter substrate-binding domain-containing protein [Ewingella americana]KFC84740.1 two-component sensory histidine kinase [Ewingella americana ATCC 33852]STQ45909.1 Virulence sensor protein BvgS precursor [Ewingella americana]